jgi:hypothetical protein
MRENRTRNTGERPAGVESFADASTEARDYFTSSFFSHSTTSGGWSITSLARA